MCVCVFVLYRTTYMRISTYMRMRYIHMYRCVHEYVWRHLCCSGIICIRIYMHVYITSYAHRYIHICICMCPYSCAYMCIYLYTHMHRACCEGSRAAQVLATRPGCKLAKHGAWDPNRGSIGSQATTKGSFKRAVRVYRAI